jgi:hypothetical protein
MIKNMQGAKSQPGERNFSRLFALKTTQKDSISKKSKIFLVGQGEGGSKRLFQTPTIPIQKEKSES